MMRALILLSSTVVTWAPVRAETLTELLAAVAVQATAPRPLRADIRIERDETPAGDAILLARGTRVYIETRSGTRALLSPGKAVVLHGTRIVRAAPGVGLEGTDVLLEDLEPFGERSLSTPQVSDETPERLVVTAAPTPPSAYVLLVHTIDRERDVILQTKYYRDSISNLVKIRRDDEFAQVGGRWRPATIAVQSFREPTSTRLSLAWREAPDAPAALFTPAGLRAPSPLRWP
jgi:Outer membrane lipoprotein-sorting protein